MTTWELRLKLCESAVKRLPILEAIADEEGNTVFEAPPLDGSDDGIDWIGDWGVSMNVRPRSVEGHPI